MFRNLILTLLLSTTMALPAFAEDQSSDTEKGFNLMEEGAQLLLRGLIQEIEPAMDDFQSMMEEFGPAFDQFAVELGPMLADLLETVDDIRNYQQPEFLPNGDIILRRKPDAPLFEPDVEDNSIEL